MINHILYCYDKDLLKIRHLIVKMGSLVEEIIGFAAEVFEIKQSDLSEKAKAVDVKVNELDNEVEVLAIEVIALRSPKAHDLRETIAALKIAVILERMGDLAKNVARKVVVIDYQIDRDTLDEIKLMTGIIIAMQQQVISSYETENLETLDLIFADEQKVDDLYRNLRVSLEDKISNNPTQTSNLIAVLFALKNFERIADYITKIAYIFKYVVTGENKNYEY